VPEAAPNAPQGRVCVGAIAGAHGVRGGVKIKSFTAEPANVAAYGPVWDEAGERRFTVKVTGSAGKPGLVRATLSGVTDRDQAEALRGVRLYVDRASLPKAGDDDFYYADLIGLRVEDESGTALGQVRGVFDFGAGDVLEIARPDGKLVMLPFTKAAVPVVDVAGGRVVVDGTSDFFRETGRDDGDEDGRE